jgi:hypothetical protein
MIKNRCTEKMILLSMILSRRFRRSAPASLRVSMNHARPQLDVHFYGDPNLEQNNFRRD